MLIPIRRANGRIYRTLVCDHCRKPIHEKDFRHATVDFTPIDENAVAEADYDKLCKHSIEHHFHAECAPATCTRSHWAKVYRALPAMVANLFNAKGSAIGKAALETRKPQLSTDISFP